MRIAHTVINLLALVCLLLSGCKNSEDASYVSHKFSIRVPEFLEVTPERSFELFNSIRPNLDSRKLLESAFDDAPEKIQKQINRWMVDPNSIHVNQFGQGQIDILMFGPGSGTESADREFQKFMEKAIIDRVRALILEATTKAEQDSSHQPATVALSRFMITLNLNPFVGDRPL